MFLHKLLVLATVLLLALANVATAFSDPAVVFSTARSPMTPLAKDSVIVRVPERHPLWGNTADPHTQQYVMMMSAEACTVTVDYTKPLEKMIQRGGFTRADTFVTRARYHAVERGCTKAKLVLRFVKIYRPCGGGACDPFYGHDYCLASLEEVLAIPPTFSLLSTPQYIVALGSGAGFIGCDPCTAMISQDKTSRQVGVIYALFAFNPIDDFPGNSYCWFAVIQTAVSLDGREFWCR